MVIVHESAEWFAFVSAAETFWKFGEMRAAAHSFLAGAHPILEQRSDPSAPLDLRPSCAAAQ